MEPHPDVHGRREENPLVGREQQRAREVVGDPLRHLGHEIGGGRCHDQEVGRARQFDVAHLGFVGEREQVVVDPLAREARDRQGGHESLGGFRHHGPDLSASFTQTPHEVERLIGRDAAADHQEDAPVRQGSFERHDLRRAPTRSRALTQVQSGSASFDFPYKSSRDATERTSTVRQPAFRMRSPSEIVPAFQKRLA